MESGESHQSLPLPKHSVVYLFSLQKGEIKSFLELIWLKFRLFFKFSACNQKRILLCNHFLWNSGWAFGCHMAVLYNYRTCYGLMDEVIKSIVISTSLLLWTAVWCHIFLAVNYICAHTEYSFLTIWCLRLTYCYAVSIQNIFHSFLKIHTHQTRQQSVASYLLENTIFIFFWKGKLLKESWEAYCDVWHGFGTGNEILQQKGKTLLPCVGPHARSDPGFLLFGPAASEGQAASYV